MTSDRGSSPCLAFVVGHPNFNFKLVRSQTKPRKDFNTLGFSYEIEFIFRGRIFLKPDFDYFDLKIQWCSKCISQ